MKKTICCILAAVMFFCSFSLPASAAEAEFDPRNIKSYIVHEERGPETILIKEVLEWTGAGHYKVYYELSLTDKDGKVTSYTSESIRVLPWNTDKASIERVCKKDENIANLYPYIKNVVVNRISEEIVKNALTSNGGDLSKFMFEGVTGEIGNGFKENTNASAGWSMVSPVLGFDDGLKNLYDNFVDFKDTHSSIITDEEAQEFIDAFGIKLETEEEKEEFQKTVSFAKIFIAGLSAMWDNIMAVLPALLDMGSNGAGLSDMIAYAVGGPSVEESPLYLAVQEQFEPDEIEYHDKVYAFLSQISE